MTLFAESTVDVKVAKRKFVFILNNKPTPLADPNPSFTTEQVRQHYQGMHAELLNAKVSSEKDEHGNETVTFGAILAKKG